MKESYRIEKIEAYEIAINALRSHKPMGDEDDPKTAQILRDRLADKLERELTRWIYKQTQTYNASHNPTEPHRGEGRR